MNYQQQPWSNDPRSEKFAHHKLFGSIRQLPRTLNRPRRPVEDQGDTLRCAAYASAVNGGYIHSQTFSASYQADKISAIQGWNIDDRGSDPNAAMKSQRDFGYLPQGAKYDDALAQNKRVAGYVKVTAHDGMDYFDAVREALVMAYDDHDEEGAVVQAFGRWFHEWTHASFIPKEYTSFAGYHAYLFVDFTTLNGQDFLIAQNSYGRNVGSEGFHYFPRDVVNKEFAQRGVSLKIAKPLTEEQIARAKENSVWGAIQRTIIQIWGIISDKYGRITRTA